MIVCSNNFIVIGFNAVELFDNLDKARLFCKENDFNIFTFSINNDLFESNIIGVKFEKKEIILNQNIFNLDSYKKLNKFKNINIGLYSVDTIVF